MKIKLYRFNPITDSESRFDSYDVPAASNWTVMDVLDYISENLDSTIAYFKHGACDHGICGRCALRVNGIARLACSTEVAEEETLEITPMNENVIRDLVVKP